MYEGVGIASGPDRVFQSQPPPVATRPNRNAASPSPLTEALEELERCFSLDEDSHTTDRSFSFSLSLFLFLSLSLASVHTFMSLS